MATGLGRALGLILALSCLWSGFGPSPEITLPLLCSLASALLWNRRCLPAALLVWTAVAALARAPMRPTHSFWIDLRLYDLADRHYAYWWTRESWLLSFAIVGLSAWLWSRHSLSLRLLRLSFYTLLLGGALFSLQTFSPEALEVALAPPVPEGYADDGRQYLRTVYLMREGQGYYQASREATYDDVRNRPDGPPIPMLRTPFYFWVWAAVPGSLDAVVLVYMLTMLGAGVACARSAWLMGAGELSLVCPCLWFPVTLYGLLACNLFYVDHWGAAWAAVAFWLYLEGRGRPRRLAYTLAALGLGLGAVWGREWMVFFWIALWLEVLVRSGFGRTKVALGGVAAGLVTLGFYLWHRSQTPVGLARSHMGEAYAIFVGWHGWRSWWGCVQYGFQLSWGGVHTAALVTGLGLVGMARSLARPGGLVLAGAGLTTSAMFFISGHPYPGPEGIKVYLSDYWGVMTLPWWTVGVPLALSPRERAAGGEAEAAC